MVWTRRRYVVSADHPSCSKARADVGHQAMLLTGSAMRVTPSWTMPVGPAWSCWQAIETVPLRVHHDRAREGDVARAVEQEHGCAEAVRRTFPTEAAIEVLAAAVIMSPPRCVMPDGRGPPAGRDLVARVRPIRDRAERRRQSDGGPFR
jgi:hypothetical protein